MARGISTTGESRGSGRSAGKFQVNGKGILFKSIATSAALFYFIYRSIYPFYDAAHNQNPDTQYLTVVSALFGLTIAAALAKQTQEPEKNINLMQFGALGMAAFAAIDAILPGGKGVGIALLQGFLAFDLVMLHPAGEKLKKLW